MPMVQNKTGTSDIGHWQRTLGRHIWFLRRAGITSAQIEREIALSLRRCVSVPKISVSTSNEELYPRILVHWQHECAYLDAQGQPRALRFEGRSPTFRSLVREAAPGADASKALVALKRYQLVSHRTPGLVRLLADGFFRGGVERGPALRLTHTALEALTDTCFANLRARQLPDWSRFQRTAYTDYLDRGYLGEYEEFLKESAQVFLTMHETWLKRHEVKNLLDPRRKLLSRVGVGLFAIRGR
jgi:hypothetical protein